MVEHNTVNIMIDVRFILEALGGITINIIILKYLYRFKIIVY